MFRTSCLFVILIGCLALSFKPKKLKTPPGTIFLEYRLFIDKTEVPNVGWREFEYWNISIKKDTSFYWRMMQDTLAWGKGSPYSEYYHNHPSFNNYPVVGVSYEQAIEFCKWRSDRVNELFAAQPGLNPIPGKKYYYRLPTVQEWEAAAAGKLDTTSYPFGLVDTIGKKGAWKGARLFNYKYISKRKNSDTARGPVDRSAYMAPVDAFMPNGYGIYNMIGNVSEMTSEKGIAKGGNYGSSLESCRVKAQQIYTKPEAWLGFRCVCEVVD